MPIESDYVELNRASSQRILALAERLTDAELLLPVGKHWTVAMALAHLAWWDRRVLKVLDVTEEDGHLVIPPVDAIVNDISLPFWAAIPPRLAVQLAVESCQELDKRLENYPVALLEEAFDYNRRWVQRSLHRNMHLDEVEAALRS